MVRCADCGFLGLRRTAERDIVEAEPLFREEGKIGPPIYDKLPLCFAREVDFRKTIPDHGDPKSKLAALQSERECDAFTEWKQGFSPKEHAEMLLHEEIREAEQQWREQQAKQDQQWREQQAERDRQWREEDRKKIETNANRRTIWAVVLSVIAAVVAAVLTPLVQAWLSG